MAVMSERLTEYLRGFMFTGPVLNHRCLNMHEEAAGLPNGLNKVHVA